MTTAIVVILAFAVGMIALYLFLRRREAEGYWDKEDHGTPGHVDPGVKYRPLEVPPKEPFD